MECAEPAAEDAGPKWAPEFLPECIIFRASDHKPEPPGGPLLHHYSQEPWPYLDWPRLSDCEELRYPTFFVLLADQVPRLTRDALVKCVVAISEGGTVFLKARCPEAITEARDAISAMLCPVGSV